MVADSQNNYDDIVDKFLEQKKQQTYLTEDENDMKIFKFHLFVFFSLLFLAMCITFVANAQQPHNLIFNLKFCFFCFLGLLFIIAIIATPIMFLIYIFNLLKSSFSEIRHDMDNVKQRKCKINPDLFKFIKKTVVFIVAFLGMMYLFFIEIGRFIVSLIHKKRYNDKYFVKIIAIAYPILPVIYLLYINRNYSANFFEIIGFITIAIIEIYIGYKIVSFLVERLIDYVENHNGILKIFIIILLNTLYIIAILFLLTLGLLLRQDFY